jgi:cyclophilin family peptidyl-prolyl cis-trans isomerase
MRFAIYGCLLWCLSNGLFSCGTKQDKSAAQPSADVILVTEKGEIAIDLFDETPQHRDNFLKLARQGFFDRLAFHRVIDEFMIQTGDPRTRETYPPTDTSAEDGPGYDLAPEFGAFSTNPAGRVGAARLEDEKNPERRSAGSQFYIVADGPPVSNRVLDSMEQVYTGILRGRLYESYQQALSEGQFEGSFQAYQAEQDFKAWHYPSQVRQIYREQGGAPWLDFTYTVFGQVTAGLDVVNAINRTATDKYDRPTKPIRVLEAKVLTDLQTNSS